MDALQDGYRRLRRRGGGVEVRIKEEEEEEKIIMLAVFKNFLSCKQPFTYYRPRDRLC